MSYNDMGYWWGLDVIFFFGFWISKLGFLMKQGSIICLYNQSIGELFCNGGNVYRKGGFYCD